MAFLSRLSPIRMQQKNTVTVPMSKAFSPSNITSSDTKRLVVGTCVLTECVLRTLVLISSIIDPVKV